MSASLEPVWSGGTIHFATTHPEAFIVFAWKDIEPQTTTRHSSPMTAPIAQVLQEGGCRWQRGDGREGTWYLGCGGWGYLDMA